MGLIKEIGILTISIVFLCSCSDKKTESEIQNEKKEFNCIELYPNGGLKSQGDTINGKYEGLYKEFYPNGNIRYINFYKQGLLNGHIKEFYENGNPKIDMYYVMNKPLGVQYVFFESDSAKVKNKFIVSRYKEKEVVASRISFNDLGDTIRDESRVHVFVLKDTFNLNDKVSIQFILNYPEFENYKIHIGNFDRNLSLRDSAGYETYEGLGHKATLEFFAEKRGRNVLRGYMEDFKIERSNPDGGFTTIGTLNNWFDVEYYVK